MTLETLPRTNTDQRAKSDLRFNSTAAVIDAVGWPLGMAFFSTSTLVEAFLLHLHASNIVVGAMPATIALGYFIPGLFVARSIRKLPVMRPWLFWIGVCERIPLLLIPVAVLFIGAAHAKLLIVAFFVLFAIHAVMLGLNQPSYWALIGKLIPMNWRGRLFGIAGLIGGLAGFFVDPIAHRLLRANGGQGLSGYAACFLFGAIVVTLSFLPLGAWRERSVEPIAGDNDPHAGHYVRDSVALLRRDRPFRLLLISAIPFAFCGAAPTYYLAASMARFHPGSTEIALYTTVLCVAGALGNPIWGAWADRSGNKVVLVSATVLAVLGAGLAVTVGSQFDYAIVFGLSALGTAGVSLVTSNMVLEFAPEDRDIPLYMAVYNVVSGPFKALAPLAYGWLADKVGFSPVFTSAAILGFISIGLVTMVKEPRRKRIVESEQPNA